MSQNWNLPPAGTDPANAVLKTNFPDAMETLRTHHSGATAPASTVAYMTWADTTSGWLKIRNAANNGWVKLAPLALDHVIDVPGSQFNVASLSATTTAKLGAVTRAGTVLKLIILCDTASTSSSGNEWQPMLRKRTNAVPGTPVNLFSGTVGTFTVLSGVGGGVEFTAYKVLEFTANQNATVAVGDVLELVMTKAGTATTLVNAVAWVVME
jgi:hypothetical protein